ncbi:MAG: hypothetical protein HN936_17470 [Bacteroidetes bacterium]|nr:hypothetical protein [Bacteroidota bacterium]MBT7463613.1 hypothetical protein [Bacteroidota bacterium]
MGFAGNVLESINGIELFYIIGLFIFIIAFITLIYRTLRISKNDLNSYKNSILEQDEQLVNRNEKTY